MPIDTPHPDYVRRLPEWTKCRDALEGEDVIKSKGKVYLPQPEGMEDDDYLNNYLARSMFYGVFEGTINGNVGVMSHKPPAINVPDVMKTWLEDVTGDEVSAERYLSQFILSEQLITGRYGVLVERSLDGSDPYFAGYAAENIISWKRDGRQLVRVVLKEPYWEEKEEDEYVLVQATQYRELLLRDGVYSVKIWRRIAQKEKKPKTNASVGKWTVIEELFPTKNGQALETIPFEFFGVDNRKPPLLDLVNLILSHYRNSADYEQLLHTLGSGTPYGVGIGDEERPSALGPTSFWASSNENAKFGILEFSGSGGSLLTNAMENKERVMASLGAKPIERQRKAVESAETARLRENAEKSVLKSIIQSTEVSFTRLLRFVADWLGLDPLEINVKLPKDFLNDRLSPAEMSAYVDAWARGAISFEVMAHNFTQGEVYPKGHDLEFEQELLKASQRDAFGESSEITAPPELDFE